MTPGYYIDTFPEPELIDKPEEKGFFTRLWEYFWDSLDLIFKKL